VAIPTIRRDRPLDLDRHSYRSRPNHRENRDPSTTRLSLAQLSVDPTPPRFCHRAPKQSCNPKQRGSDGCEQQQGFFEPCKFRQERCAYNGQPVK
jgi:hypothetical protein